MNSCNNSHINRNEISGNGFDGINLGNCKKLYVDQNTLTDNGSSDKAVFGEGRGIYLGNSKDLDVTNNSIDHNVKYGILLYRVDSSLFSGNIMDANGKSDNIYSNTGIVIEESDKNNFEANTIKNHPNNGIEIIGSSQNSFFENYIEMNGNIGFLIQGQSSNNDISQNHINENSKFGILINNQSDGIEKLSVRSNSIFCNGEQGLYNLGLDSVIIDTHWIDQSNKLHAKTRLPYAKIEIFNNEMEIECDTCQSQQYIASTIANENGDFNYTITNTFDNITFSVSDPVDGIVAFSTCSKVKDAVTGTSRNNSILKTAYPNPTSNTCIIPNSGLFTVYDAIGNVIENGVGNKIDLSNQPTGVYLIKTNEETYRIVKE